MNERLKKAEALVEGNAVKALGGERFYVHGTRGMPYTVDIEHDCCTCPDYLERVSKGFVENVSACKHMYAVELFIQRALQRQRKLHKRAWARQARRSRFDADQIEANIARMAS